MFGIDPIIIALVVILVALTWFTLALGFYNQRLEADVDMLKYLLEAERERNKR